jgi:hypothetical protein
MPLLPLWARVACYRVKPYLTLPYITLPYITLPYITLHYLTLHYLTLLWCYAAISLLMVLQFTALRLKIQPVLGKNRQL